jgi:hypothetical protein
MLRFGAVTQLTQSPTNPAWSVLHAQPSVLDEVQPEKKRGGVRCPPGGRRRLPREAFGAGLPVGEEPRDIV